MDSYDGIYNYIGQKYNIYEILHFLIFFIMGNKTQDKKGLQ